MLLLLKFHVSLQNIFLQESMIALHFLWLLKLKCACLIFFLFPAQVLWPYLLECLVPEPFTHAMNPLCRCICHLASKKREEQAEDFAIDFDAKGICDTHSLILFSKRSFDNVVFLQDRKEVHYVVLSLMKGLVKVTHCFSLFTTGSIPRPVAIISRLLVSIRQCDVNGHLVAGLSTYS